MKRIVRIGQTTIGVVGVLGTLACMGSMVHEYWRTRAGGKLAAARHPGLPAASRTGDPARLHWCVRLVPGFQALGGCHPCPAGRWRHLLGHVRPAAFACDVRHHGAWPARLGRCLPLGPWPPSQKGFLSLRRREYSSVEVYLSTSDNCKMFPHKRRPERRRAA